MISKMRERVKNKKGFTLVELIVVLVILAILIALLVPTLTGYIDKANEKKVLAEAKLALNAAQVMETEAYSTKSTATSSYTGETDFDVVANSTKDDDAGKKAKELIKLSEIGTKIADKEITVYKYTSSSDGKISELTFSNAKYTAKYKDGVWSTDDTK